MKQIILKPYVATDATTGKCLAATFEDECLGKVITRWTLFGLAMWWLSDVAGSHVVTWSIGLFVAFALVRKEFGA